ncbi:type II toxin-antitoxin system VapC family toxin [Thermococcus sp. JdF3]|nr:type II toxin-antitoxin system VapC family toxin [Thermococcus sp. JdF3]
MKSRSRRASRSTGLIIDTSVLANWVNRGRKDLLSKYKGSYISAITLFEFLRGIRDDKKRKRALRDFKRLYKVIHVDTTTAVLASEMYVELQRRGTPHDDDGDLLVAATALKRNLTVLTADNGFKKFRNLGVDVILTR